MIKYKFVEISLGTSGAVVEPAVEAESEVGKAIANITDSYFDLMVAMGKIGYKPSSKSPGSPVFNDFHYFVKEYKEAQCIKIEFGEIIDGETVDIKATSLSMASNSITIEIFETINEFKGGRINETDFIRFMIESGWRIVASCATSNGYMFER